MNLQTLALVMPCFNEGTAAAHVMASIAEHAPDWRKNGISSVLVVLVDDGSSRSVERECIAEMNKLQVRFPASVRLAFLRHSVNLGQGAALRTGMQYALQEGCDAVVTLDSDGQHPVAQIPDLLAPIQTGTQDIVFGNRFGALKAIAIPRVRKWVLTCATYFERAVTGLRLSDAHNGFRAMTRATAELMRLEQNRMAHATEIKQIVARHRLRYTEVPVTILYTDETLAKGQRSSGAAIILKDLLKQYLFEQ